MVIGTMEPGKGRLWRCGERQRTRSVSGWPRGKNPGLGKMLSDDRSECVWLLSWEGKSERLKGGLCPVRLPPSA